MINPTDIKSPADIKSLDIDQLKPLCESLRPILLKKLGAHGGHIGPNLGFLEATVALHYVFDSPKDKMVFDVSHQTYVHKMLTGRMEAFADPDHYNDVSGYTNPSESDHDMFEIGHTSTAVALAGGLAKARDLKGEKSNVIAIVGDGSLSGGEAFEGLDFGATLDSNFIVVVNDNDMSIAENHGGLYSNLRELRESDGNAPCNYFKTLGYDYLYVAYGNDPASLVDAFRRVKDTDHPVVVHINTQKGHGYAPAETYREKFHYGAPFDIPTGAPLNFDESVDYGDITSEWILNRMTDDKSLVTITAGTPGAIGFTPERRKRAGKRFIDVGIAEQDAVALASGLAKGGMRPVFGVVSSFVQRAYDQLSQDVAINSTTPVFVIFYGTMYGMNDVTHLGWFDIVLLSNIPRFVYLAPTCREEYEAMLAWATSQKEHPVVVRVPGCVVKSSGRIFTTDYSDINKFEITHRGNRVAIIGAGTFYDLGCHAAAQLKDKGIDATVINPRFLSGVDSDLLESLKEDHTLVITLEDGIVEGGFGQKIAAFYGPSNMKVKCYGLKKEFADRYNYSDLARECHLTPGQITDDIISILG